MNILLFFKKNYEKFILGILLLVFIALLVLLAFLVRETKSIKAVSVDPTSTLRANYTPKADKDYKQDIDLMKDVDLWQKKESKPLTNTTKALRVAKEFACDFVMPAPLTICPKCRKAIPWSDFKVSSEDGKFHCSICTEVLSPPMEVVWDDKGKDTDNDKMPDSYENAYQRFGYSANDPSDANKDFDNDFFTNLEEYYCDTDPLNPRIPPRKSGIGGKYNGRYPYSHLLQCLDVEVKTYSFKVSGAGMRPGEVTITAKETYIDRATKRPRERFKEDMYLKAGSVFRSLDENMKILSIKEDKVKRNYTIELEDLYTGDRIKVVTDGRGKHDPVVSERPRATVLFRGEPGKTRKVKKGDTLTFGNSLTGVDKYTVKSVNVQEKNLVLTDAGGKDVVIGREMIFKGIYDANAKKKESEKEAEKKSGPRRSLRERK